MKFLINAIKEGIVIDHIPSSHTLLIMNLLSLETHKTDVLVAYNLSSKRMGRKGLIKIADKEFSQKEIDSIALLANNATLNIIKDHVVIVKKIIKIPQLIEGIAVCPNRNCISNFEVESRFLKISENSMKCYYCEKIFKTSLLYASKKK